MSSWEIRQGDCLDILPTLAENSVDTVVTDPPAGIAFMNKTWDSDRGGSEQWIDWLATVMIEVRRVLKPGGALLCWSIPRTSHWTGTAIERAGFRIVDVITHLFGQGFCKSHNISKAIDRAAGVEREVVGISPNDRPRSQVAGGRAFDRAFDEGQGHETLTITAPATPAAQLWEGWGTALSPAAEFWWLAYNPREGTYAANALRYGVSGIWVDGGRIAVGPEGLTKGGCTKYGGTFGSGAKVTNPDGHPSGRWPKNCIFSHVPDSPCFCRGDWAECPYCGGTGTVPECRRVGTKRVKASRGGKVGGGQAFGKERQVIIREETKYFADPDGLETVEAWECVEGGTLTSPVMVINNRTISGLDGVATLYWAINRVIRLLRQCVEAHDNHSMDKRIWLDYDALRALGWSKLPSFQVCCLSGRRFCDVLARMIQVAAQASVPQLADVLEIACHSLEVLYSPESLLGDHPSSGDGSCLFEPSQDTEPNSISEHCVLSALAGRLYYILDTLLAETSHGDAEDSIPESNKCAASSCDMTKTTCRNACIDTVSRVLFGLACNISSMFNLAPVYHTVVSLPSCPIRMLDEQSGILKSGSINGTYRNTIMANRPGQRDGKPIHLQYQGDSGSASRYFLNLPGESRFLYCAKASKRERDAGLDDMPYGKSFDKNTSKRIRRIDPDTGNITFSDFHPSERRNDHPCVKPVKLMRYLVRLTKTPTGGVVLDPFMGSGSTGVACLLEGRDFVGIEMDEHYVAIARARIEDAQKQPRLL